MEIKPQYKTNCDDELVFLIDGEEHTVGDSSCCGSFGQECKCEGIIHFQPVYGGIVYRCDQCGKYV